MIEREPVTIVVSREGLDPRAERPCRRSVAGLQFKGDDALQTGVLRRDHVENSGAGERRQGFHARRIAIAGRTRAGRADPADGRYRGKRGRSPPSFPIAPARKMLVASSDGRGFVARRTRCLAARAKARRLLNVDAPATAALIVPADGDHVAAIGENRKLLVFPLAQLPEMARGKGVRLQRYKDGGLSDAQRLRIARRPDLAGFRQAARSRWRRANCATGSATAPKPAACRRKAFRRTIGLGEHTYGGIRE